MASRRGALVACPYSHYLLCEDQAEQVSCVSIGLIVVLFFFFSCIPYITLALLSRALPPSSNSDPGSYSRFFSPLPTYGACLHFYRENNSAFFFPRRLARVELCTNPRC